MYRRNRRKQITTTTSHTRLFGELVSSSIERKRAAVLRLRLRLSQHPPDSVDVGRQCALHYEFGEQLVKRRTGPLRRVRSFDRIPNKKVTTSNRENETDGIMFTMLLLVCCCCCSTSSVGQVHLSRRHDTTRPHSDDGDDDDVEVDDPQPLPHRIGPPRRTLPLDCFFPKTRGGGPVCSFKRDAGTPLLSFLDALEQKSGVAASLRRRFRLRRERAPALVWRARHGFFVVGSRSRKRRRRAAKMSRATDSMLSAYIDRRRPRRNHHGWHYSSASMVFLV